MMDKDRGTQLRPLVVTSNLGDFFFFGLALVMICALLGLISVRLALIQHALEAQLVDPTHADD